MYHPTSDHPINLAVGRPLFTLFAISTVFSILALGTSIGAQQPKGKSNTSSRGTPRTAINVAPKDSPGSENAANGAPANRSPNANRGIGGGQLPATNGAVEFSGPVQGPPRVEDLFPRQLKQPEWFPLKSQDEKFLNEVLNYWEQQSDKIDRYECKIKRWEYDPVYGPRGENEFRTYSEGEIKYLDPDKGMFKINKTHEWVRPKGDSGEQNGKKKSDYATRNVEFDDYWVCDGEYVWQFDAKLKKVNRTTLPENMRGTAISDGPLPFLFGAKAEKIKSRYWIRPLLDIPPNPNQKEGERDYYLEAIPKSQNDAANFKAVIVTIDGKDFLPKDMTIYAITYDPSKGNFARTRLVFESRQVNPKSIRSISPFHQDFFKVKVPKDWQLVDQDLPDTTQPSAPPGPPRGNVQETNRPVNRTARSPAK